MKLAVPLTVAGFLAEKAPPPQSRTTITALVMVVLPAGLIIDQPIGIAILVSASGLFVLFFGGISWRFMRNSALVGIAAAPFGWLSMHEYQRQRILTLLDPSQDPWVIRLSHHSSEYRRRFRRSVRQGLVERHPRIS